MQKTANVLLNIDPETVEVIRKFLCLIFFVEEIIFDEAVGSEKVGQELSKPNISRFKKLRDNSFNFNIIFKKNQLEMYHQSINKLGTAGNF